MRTTASSFTGIPDNISDVLAKIIHFTQLRRAVLYRNMQGLSTPGYVPKDLPVLEFAEVLDGAISEHIQHHRLLYRDTANIKFGRGSTMQVRSMTDNHAKALVETNRDEYLDLQINKLLENCLHHRAAEELMRQDSAPALGLLEADLDEVAVDDLPSQANSTD